MKYFEYNSSMVYFAIMSIPVVSLSGGRSPEMSESFVSAQREIGIKTCQFISSIDTTNPLTLAFGYNRTADIVERAILNSVGYVQMPGLRDGLYNVKEGNLIRQFVERYSSDAGFNDGGVFMRRWVGFLNQYISGAAGFPLNLSARGISYEGVTFALGSVKASLESDPRGLSLIRETGMVYENKYNLPSSSSYSQGIRFGVNLYAAACLFYTEQELSELRNLQGAIPSPQKTSSLFLRNIDALMERL